MWAIPPVILWEPRDDEPLPPPERLARAFRAALRSELTHPAATRWPNSRKGRTR